MQKTKKLLVIGNEFEDISVELIILLISPMRIVVGSHAKINKILIYFYCVDNFIAFFII